MVRHIIFDFGGVILRFDLKKDGIPGDLAHIFNISLDKATTIWRKHRDPLIRGEETPLEFLHKMNTLLTTEKDITEAHAIWQQRYRKTKEEINWEVVKLIEQLKEQCHIHLLSDTIGLKTDDEVWMHEIDQHFKNTYRSHEIGRKKPDKETFLYVLEKIKAKAEECIFIDDAIENVAAARSLGLHAIQYDTFENLVKALKKLGIKYKE